MTETLQKAYGPRECLRTIVVRCGALQCTAETVQKPCGPLERLQTIVVNYDAQGRRQVKQSGVDSMDGVWGVVSPPKSRVGSGDTI